MAGMRSLLRTISVIVAVVCVGALNACSSAGPRAADTLLAVPLETIDGAGVQLADVGDDLVVVNFWASYCKPCIREMPALQRVADAHPQVRFIGVNALDERELAEQLVAETGVRYEIWLDSRGDAMRAADVRSLPGTLILYGSTVVYVKLGEISEAELADALALASS
jgi:thiol-disulfide isomerase/thioredoxin